MSLSYLLNGVLYIRTQEYCLALGEKKRNSHTCCNIDVLEDIMLTKISQSQKTNTIGVHSHEVPIAVKFRDRK
jgi:hypothetical protein